MVNNITSNIEKFHKAIKNEYNIHGKSTGDVLYGFTSNDNVLLQDYNSLYEHEKREFDEYNNNEIEGVKYIASKDNSKVSGVYVFLK